MERFTELKKSLIFAADMEREHLCDVTEAIRNVQGLSAIKLGFRMAFEDLEKAAFSARVWSRDDVKIIYDHQKAGNDIPDMGIVFAKALKKARVDIAILFPFTGPETQKEWTKACIGEGLQVMTGGMMTHTALLHSEGGYIADDAPERIYKNACALGVEHFVVPGNKPEWVQRIRGWLITELGEGNFTLSAPGFISQKGDITECGKVAGKEWHAIVGSAIYKASDPEAVAQRLAAQILSA